MKLDKLKESRNLKIDNIEQFKTIVIEAIEHTCHWKEYGDWLHEEYEICSSNDNHQYKALIIVTNDCYNSKTPTFACDYKKISSVTIYDIFYTDTCGGGFVIDDITLQYDAIKSFLKLLKGDKNNG